MDLSGTYFSRMSMRKETELSIIIPVHNEENAIGPLLREIIGILRTAMDLNAEIIIIDDASTDGSVREIEEIDCCTSGSADITSEAMPLIRLFSLPSSFGQACALRSGFSRAQGRLLLTMDGDGQHDPADIPRLVGMMETYDMVCGVRNRRTDGPARLICSRIANGFRNVITGDRITDAGCTFRIMRRDCLGCLDVFSEQSIGYDFFFHPLSVRSGGFSVGEISIAHRKRFASKSKYHLVRGRLLSGLLDCIKVRNFLAEKHSPGRITTVRRQ